MPNSKGQLNIDTTQNMQQPTKQQSPALSAPTTTSYDKGQQRAYNVKEAAVQQYNHIISLFKLVWGLTIGWLAWPKEINTLNEPHNVADPGSSIPGKLSFFWLHAPLSSFHEKCATSSWAFC